MTETGSALEGGAEQAAADDGLMLAADSPIDAPVDGQNIDLLDSGPAGWRAYLRALGPGLVTGASDDDPSGIAALAKTAAPQRAVNRAFTKTDRPELLGEATTPRSRRI